MARKTNEELLAIVRKVLELTGSTSSLAYDKCEYPGKPGRTSVCSRFNCDWQRLISLAQGAEDGVSPTLRSIFERPEFLDLNESKLDALEWLKACEELKERYEDASTGQQIATVKLPVDRPVAIAYVGDIHLGSIATDYKEFRRNLEFIMETPDLYMITVGDTVDNFISFPDKSAVLSQLIPADKQKLLFEAILDELLRRGKLLAVGWGDHDVRFDERLSGSPIIQQLVKNKVPYFPGRGLIKLRVGRGKDPQEYTNVITHRSRYSSYLNEVWASSQEYRLFFPGDVVVTAHHHSPAYAVVNRYPVAREAGFAFGGEVALIRTGTYKIEDGYSMRFWNKGIIGVPTVVYYPDRFLFDVYRSAERAVELGLRQEGGEA